MFRPSLAKTAVTTLTVAMAGLLSAPANPAVQNAGETVLRAKITHYLERIEKEAGLPLRKTEVSIRLVDLNADGTPEALAVVRDSTWCGSGGCTAFVLDLSGPVARSIGDFLAVKLESSQTDGWRDISVSGRGGGRKVSFRGGQYGGAAAGAASARRPDSSTAVTGLPGTWLAMNHDTRFPDGCEGDIGITYKPDGTYELLEESGTWRLEGERLIETPTEATEAAEPGSVKIGEPRTSRLQWRGPNEFTLTADGHSATLKRCPSALPPAPSGRVHAALKNPSCTAEREYKSLEGSRPTTVKIVNESVSPVRLYWLDYNGTRKLYATIRPRRSHTQPTYLTHPWVVTDLADKCIAMYMPEARPRQFSIRFGAPAAGHPRNVF